MKKMAAQKIKISKYYHLLPAANAEVTNTFDDLFDMCLLECLDVYVASQSFLRYYRLYLQWLQCTIHNQLHLLQIRQNRQMHSDEDNGTLQ